MLNNESNIIQSNYLIENKPAMSKDEARLFLSIVSLIDSNTDKFDNIYKLPVREFAVAWGMNLDSAYYKLRDAVKGLGKKRFFIEDINKETQKIKFLDSAFLASTEYEQGNGYAEIEISSKFKPFLLELKKTYTKYILENVVNLSLGSSIRLYELLKQYQNIGIRKFDINEFKRYIGISGKYEGNNANLKKGVINPAVEDINKNTDLLINYKIVGRGITAVIQFYIKEKRNIPLAKQEIIKANRNKDLAKEVLQANNINALSEDFIEWILKTVDKTQIKNIDRYISTCLQNVENITNYKKYISDDINKQNRAVEQEQILGQLELEITQDKEEKAREYFEGIPDEIMSITNVTERIKAISNFKNIVKEI